eukprot:scaffold55918_cov46-Prasinocladus_malaysianus.AAC.1
MPLMLKKPCITSDLALLAFSGQRQPCCPKGYANRSQAAISIEKGCRFPTPAARQCSSSGQAVACA